MEMSNANLIEFMSKVLFGVLFGDSKSNNDDATVRTTDEEYSKWLHSCASTHYVPDEMTRVYTIEITEVCKRSEEPGALELTDGEAKTLCKMLENAIKNNLEADDVKVTKFQQFVTKGHEVRVR